MPTFAPRELDVMTVLWTHGPSTVSEVRERLDRAGHALAYTTVLTILRTLEAKEYVAHAEEGRAHRYRSLVARADARESALRRLVGTVFGGSAELLLTQLVEDEALAPDELRRMRARLDQRLQERDPASSTGGQSDTGPSDTDAAASDSERAS